MKRWLASFAVVWSFLAVAAVELPEPKFEGVQIDRIEIGYGVAVADVDGDLKPDILLADKRQVAWYKNPSWEKFVIAENLTKFDNVCLAARDIDGDGKAEVAVGAEWNPGDTVNSGAVFYLLAPEDRRQRWEPLKLHHEPTVHRMQWVKNIAGKFDLVVLPLHGRGNKNAEGAGVRILSYQVPSNPRNPWKTELIDQSLHATHNFTLVDWAMGEDQEVVVAGREAIMRFVRRREVNEWKGTQYIGKESSKTPFNGAGEVRTGKMPGGKDFIVTIEPMHGNELVVYSTPGGDRPVSFSSRKVLDATLAEGHALACGDLLGVGYDQIVAGWRGKNGSGKVGIKLCTPKDADALEWNTVLIDDNGIACEDLCLADLNGDGKLDIIASGRATKNLKVYFNKTKR